jgi:hypothetical protein
MHLWICNMQHLHQTPPTSPPPISLYQNPYSDVGTSKQARSMPLISRNVERYISTHTCCVTSKKTCQWYVTLLAHAVAERISGVVDVASAHGRMVDDAALGVWAASARARVPAFLVYAGLVAGALGVNDALGAAVGWRADVRRQARAGGAFAAHLALRVWSARRRLARIASRPWSLNSN